MNFLSELATNATAHDISVILFSGNNDVLVAHRGTEGANFHSIDARQLTESSSDNPSSFLLRVMHISSNAIQNTTFGGIQGFTRKPSTPWTDDAGNPGGIVHQERGWTYVLFNNTGHLIPAKNPVAASAIKLTPHQSKL